MTVLIDRADDGNGVAGASDVDAGEGTAFALSGALGDYESLAREDAAGLGL